MAHQTAPGGDLLRHPGTLDGVSILKRDLWILQGERPDLYTALFRLIQATSEALDERVS